MRKLLAISQIMLLLVATVGITVHKHYCESSLIATTVLPHADHDPCDADMPMDEDACRDIHDHYAVDSPLTVTNINFSVEPVIDWLAPAWLTWAPVYKLNSNPEQHLADLPPPPSEPGIYIRVQAFLL
ncbi:MAG TPA: hypothetical protein ENJ39_05490 [Flammeovirgaceae bacterium]|nr:hypothetical protein [Flammeovirgaceae bacterium]